MRIALISVCIAALVFFHAAGSLAQVAAIRDVDLAIVKAEDARRYDKTLEAFLSSATERVRLRAALAAGRIGDEGAVAPLIKILETDQSPHVREMAAFALGEIESINSADAIIRGLKKDPQPADARLVEAAGKIAGANAGFRLGLWLGRRPGVAQLRR